MQPTIARTAPERRLDGAELAGARDDALLGLLGSCRWLGGEIIAKRSPRDLE
jgi:hypothetical protein